MSIPRNCDSGLFLPVPGIRNCESIKQFLFNSFDRNSEFDYGKNAKNGQGIEIIVLLESKSTEL